jgi:hypothetical protein
MSRFALVFVHGNKLGTYLNAHTFDGEQSGGELVLFREHFQKVTVFFRSSALYSRQ